MSQHWCDLAFLHWRIAPELVAVHLPPGVRPDEFDGSAWVGLIPFRMVDAGPGRGHPVPWLGTFWESNVRVYTTDDAGRRGVTFLSLETERAAVVLGARGVFNVPYYWARMGGSRGGSAPGVHSVRDYWTTRLAPHRSRPASGVSLQIGERLAEPGPLEHFLTARFGLHTRVLGQPCGCPTHTAPGPCTPRASPGWRISWSGPAVCRTCRRGPPRTRCCGLRASTPSSGCRSGCESCGSPASGVSCTTRHQLGSMALSTVTHTVTSAGTCGPGARSSHSALPSIRVIVHARARSASSRAWSQTVSSRCCRCARG